MNDRGGLGFATSRAAVPGQRFVESRPPFVDRRALGNQIGFGDDIVLLLFGQEHMAPEVDITEAIERLGS